MTRFEGRTVVVAGGAGGIGRACAELFKAEGADVHVIDRNGTPPVDVTEPERVDAFFASIGPPHVLVNAVGDANLQLVLDQPVGEFRRIVDVELIGAYVCLQAAARRMVHAGLRGSIVTISSINGEYPSRGLSGHCAAKAGVDMLTRVAAVELGAHGIRVNAVAPACTLTPLIAPFAQVPSYAAAIKASTPLDGRMGKPEEIASAVAFLASEEARWVTGRTLNVDGGQGLVFIPDPLDAARDAGEQFQSQVVPSS